MSKWWLPVMSMALVSATVVARGDEPTTKPTDKSHKTTTTHWGFAPYNKLTDLTTEQKTKITDIHKKASADIKEIEDKQDADILALLTDEQKEELDKLAADKKAEAADKRAAAKKDKDDEDKK